MGARGRKSKAELMVVLARAAELAEQTAQGSRDSRHHIEAALISANSKLNLSGPLARHSPSPGRSRFSESWAHKALGRRQIWPPASGT